MNDDTIAAISSAGGPIGLIRVSGEKATEAVSAIFRANNGKPLTDAPTQKLTLGKLFNRSGKMIDCCYAVIMRAPRTYTGEPMAELQCHGSVAVLQEALAALFAHGVRQAEAGEFTRRAYLNGRIELSEAEAVHDLITARTAEAAQNAAAQMMGAVASPIREIREDLIGMAAHFYAVVDFPDEEVTPMLLDDSVALLERAAARLSQMAESYERGRILREGIPCVILGRPNVGKSTLLNALLGRERAIVTDIPGTTRDLIEETIKIGQLLLRVTDTAGLRHTEDPIEQVGINRALATATASALTLVVFDGSQPFTEEDEFVLSQAAGQCSIAIINKSDLPQQLDKSILQEKFARVISIAARTGDGLSALVEAIPETLQWSDGALDGAMITNARQAAALTRAAERCQAALTAAQSGMSPDVVIMDAEGAIAALGEITGETVTEAVVSRIFSDFCVGK